MSFNEYIPEGTFEKDNMSRDIINGIFTFPIPRQLIDSFQMGQR